MVAFVIVRILVRIFRYDWRRHTVYFSHHWANIREHMMRRSPGERLFFISYLIYFKFKGITHNERHSPL